MLGTFVCRILLVRTGCDFNVWLSGCFCLPAKALYKLCFIKTTIKIKLIIIIIIIIFRFGGAPDLNLDFFFMKDWEKQNLELTIYLYIL